MHRSLEEDVERVSEQQTSSILLGSVSAMKLPIVVPLLLNNLEPDPAQAETPSVAPEPKSAPSVLGVSSSTLEAYRVKAECLRRVSMTTFPEGSPERTRVMQDADEAAQKADLIPVLTGSWKVDKLVGDASGFLEARGLPGPVRMVAKGMIKNHKFKFEFANGNFIETELGSFSNTVHTPCPIGGDWIIDNGLEGKCRKRARWADDGCLELEQWPIESPEKSCVKRTLNFVGGSVRHTVIDVATDNKFIQILKPK